MNKLMMKLTIGSEAVFFICLIVAYLYFWRSGNFRKEVTTHLNVRTAAVSTVLLLTSSFTFRRAEKNHQRENSKGVKGWLLATILLGCIFLTAQGREYYRLLQENVWVSKSEFGSTFYSLTGFHGLHVLIGLIILTTVFLLTRKGYLNNKDSTIISTVGIYWHFVDVVWIFVFTVVYLMPFIL